MAKVLVAEDEPEIRNLLVATLEEAGYETRGTFDGLGALGEVKDFKPDVLILDWMMPELTGNEVLNAIRHDDDYADHKKIRVIVVSDFAGEEGRKTFAHVGADDFIAKTGDPDMLKANLLIAVKQQLEAIG